MGRVQEKVALVTGGASGIGFATAKLLLEEGAKVVLTDLAGEASQRAVAALQKESIYRQLDVTREDQWIAVTDTLVREFGRLDSLISNAGVAFWKDIEATTLDEW